MYSHIIAQLEEVVTLSGLRYLEESTTDEGALDIIRTWFSAEQLEQLKSVDDITDKFLAEHFREPYWA